MAFCHGNPPGTGGFLRQRASTSNKAIWSIFVLLASKSNNWWLLPQKGPEMQKVFCLSWFMISHAPIFQVVLLTTMANGQYLYQSVSKCSVHTQLRNNTQLIMGSPLLWIPYCIWLLRFESTAWLRFQMETFSALLAIFARNSQVPGEFPAQRPVTQRFDVIFDLRPNKRLSKQSWGWWFEASSHPLWCHRNALRELNK